MKLRWKKRIRIKLVQRSRGSSSVLVIMIMLLLITFGVLAMMSSYSNLKIARKHAQWTQDYYQLESLADSDLKTFEILFNKAMTDTQKHFVSQTIDPSTFDRMPDAIKAKFTNNVHALEPENSAAVNALKSQLFLYHLYDAYRLSPLFENHNSSNFDYESVTETAKPEWVPEIVFATKDKATNRQLRVKIAIDARLADGHTNTFSVMEWCEVPAEFEYDETLNFEDPEGN